MEFYGQKTHYTEDSVQKGDVFPFLQIHKCLNEQNSPSALIYLLCMRSCSTELLISVFLCTKQAVVTECNYIFLILLHFQISKKLD